MKFTITEIKTIATMIEVEANSYEEVEKNYEDGMYSDMFDEQELEQWNISESYTEIDEINN